MKTNISIISKESTTAQIRKYFTKVLDLSKQENEYPVNLNEVWALVYNQKSDAVKVLKKDFIENVDYQVLRQIPQNPKGGRPSEEYILSVPCLEFFIARKIRPVFDVYRKVFHSKMNGLVSPKLRRKIEKLGQTRREYSKSLMSKFQSQHELYPDLYIGNIWDDKDSLENNISRLVSALSYNTGSAVFECYKAYTNENKLKSLQTDIHKTFHEIGEKFDFYYY